VAARFVVPARFVVAARFAVPARFAVEPVARFGFAAVARFALPLRDLAADVRRLAVVPDLREPRFGATPSCSSICDSSCPILSARRSVAARTS
jgi:hypothetical protein